MSTHTGQSSVLDVFNKLTASLASVLPEGEAKAAARIIFEDVAGYNRTRLWADGSTRTLLPDTQERIEDIGRQVVAGVPVQYAVGSARFCGMNIKVTPAVLIPRPETEGLVDIVTDTLSARKDLDILDCCTGNGCIAVALQRALPFASVDACDISTQALEVARGNGRDLAPQVHFFEADVLNLPPEKHARYDAIVSNPPYVLPSEKKDMSPRVLDHEPALALFVPEEDPLVFYDAIARYGMTALRLGGYLFFEFNNLEVDALRNLLESLAYKDVELRRDIHGKYRYAIARR